MLEIIIKGEAKEIAALAAAMQERREGYPVKVKIDRGEIFKAVTEAMCDTGGNIQHAGSDAPGPVVTAK